MKSVSAKELKNKTGSLLRRVAGGERILITKRGKPHALLSPVGKEQLQPAGLRSYEHAWTDIETTLKSRRPRFKTWQDAIRWTRWRT